MDPNDTSKLTWVITMFDGDKLLELAATHVHENYPPGWRAVQLAELESPPGLFFEAEPWPADERRFVGSGGFFVYRETGQVQSFGSGRFNLASIAVQNDLGKSDLRATVEYMLGYSENELHQRARHKRLPGNLGWTGR